MSRFRVVAVGLVAAGLFTLGTGAAHAIDPPPVPENPASMGQLSLVLPAPNPLPPVGDPWNPKDHTSILEQYGGAGPTLRYYDVNMLEAMGASTNVQLANAMMGISKFWIAVTAALADWVFNPSNFADALAGATNGSAAVLSESLASPLLPVILLVIAIAIAVAARKGRLGQAATRVAYVIVGLVMVGVATLSPASVAGGLSGMLAHTVTGVLAPAPPQEIQSDRDAIEADRVAKATAGRRMMAPIWDAAVVGPWLTGTLGSQDSYVARTYGPVLLKNQALTWQEAASIAPPSAEEMAKLSPEAQKAKLAEVKKASDELYKAKRDGWVKAAADVKDSGDQAAYAQLKGMGDTFGPALFSWVATLACLAFVFLAMLMILAAYLMLYLFVAALPVIGIAVIAHPPTLRRAGMFLATLVADVVALTAGSLIITNIAKGVLVHSGAVLGTVIVGVAGWVMWKMWRTFHKSKDRATSGAAAVGAVTASTAGTWAATKNTGKKVGKKAYQAVTNDKGGPEVAPKAPDQGAPAGANGSRPPVETQPYAPQPQTAAKSNGSNGSPAPATAPVNGTATGTATMVSEGHGTTVTVGDRPAPATNGSRPIETAPYEPGISGSANTDEEVLPEAATRPTPAQDRVAYDPLKWRLDHDDEETA